MTFILFHGTTTGFEGAFKLIEGSAVRQEMGEAYDTDAAAFFFTDDFDTAKQFAESRAAHKNSTPQVIRVKATLHNPLDLRINDADWPAIKAEFPNLCNFDGINPLTASEMEVHLGYGFTSWGEVHQALDNSYLINALQIMGYDAIILKEENGATSYCVFDSFDIEIQETACPLN